MRPIRSSYFLTFMLVAGSVTLTNSAPGKRSKPVTPQRVIDKIVKPNPKVRPPQTRPMPVEPPVMPPSPEQVVPPEATGSERFFKKVAAVMTTTWNRNIFVWLPAISTDPNTGFTFGLLPVLVLSDQTTNHIRHLVAPSYTYNSFFRHTVTGRYYYYPNDSSQLFGIASLSAKTNREARLRYENSKFLSDRFYLRAEGGYQVNGGLRFFGIGPTTVENSEAGYVGKESRARGAMGVNFFEHCRFSVGLRFRRLLVDNNIIPDVDDLKTAMPTLLGINRMDTVTSEARFLFDTRDLPVTPSRGNSSEIYVEKTNKAFGSDSDFFRFGIEGKQFVKHPSPKHLSVLRATYEQVKGPRIPFYELATVGGRDSLRGFGNGRFSDQGRIAFNVEHRVQIASLSLMGVQTNFEVGPFVDLGTVFPNLNGLERKNVRFVGGGAFRAAVKPNVVGAVDVGFGQEGLAVFVDINYPF